MRKILFALIFALFCGGQVASAQDEPLRIIAVFAHPDDADSRMSGTAIQWAKMGHKVKFVSITNGDAGHFETGGARLAQRRRWTRTRSFSTCVTVLRAPILSNQTLP